MQHPIFKIENYEDTSEEYKEKADYYENLVKEYEQILGNPIDEIYGIVTERDTDNGLQSRGAMMHGF